MTPEKLKERLKAKQLDEPKDQNLWSKLKAWSGVYAAVLATSLTTYTVYEKFKPKTHDLTIYVADIKQNNGNIEFVVGYYNDGDFSEVVSNAEAVLGQVLKGYSGPLPWQQGECFQPVVVQPKKSQFRVYSSKIDFQSDELSAFKGIQTQTYDLTFNFDVLSLKHGVVKERLKVGVLKPIEQEPGKRKAQIDFITTKQKVNFEKARPRITRLTYPVEKEYLRASICTVKT